MGASNSPALVSQKKLFRACLKTQLGGRRLEGRQESCVNPLRLAPEIARARIVRLKAHLVREVEVLFRHALSDL
jgi:hypothetical protein